MNKVHEIRKKLSSNELGRTGSHQAGILIPKSLRDVDFFPILNCEEFNPRRSILFKDESSGERVQLNYIFYNGKDLGLSTRSEYRLTGLTSYFKQHLAQVGDELLLARSEEGEYSISLIHAKGEPDKGSAITNEVIKLSGNWVSIKRGKIL